MPNPNDPAEEECSYCHDTGYITGTYRVCHHCRGGPIRTLDADTTPPVFSPPNHETKETQNGC